MMYPFVKPWSWWWAPLTMWFPLLIVIFIADLVLKGVAMWYAARNEHKGWFIAILVLNTFGILPIIYLIFFSNPQKGKKK